MPDDISALQADVDAYHREQRRTHRVVRRLTASQPWHQWAPLGGVVAGALALTAIVFVVLTIGDTGAGHRAARLPVAAAPAAGVGAQGGLLPDDYFDYKIVRPHLVITFLLVAGLVIGLVRWWFTDYSDTEVLFPGSESEAVQAFGEGRGVTVFAGGTILMPAVAYGRYPRGGHTLMLKGAGLDQIAGDGTVRIGATTAQG